jgi:hypothetical protein
MKPGFYKCDLYRMEFYFCVRWKPEAFQSYMLKHQQTEVEVEDCAGFSVMTNCDLGVRIFLWSCPEDKDNSHLVHECVHAANMTLHSRGVKADFKNDEAVAYLTEMIFKKALTKNRRAA